MRPHSKTARSIASGSADSARCRASSLATTSVRSPSSSTKAVASRSSSPDSESGIASIETPPDLQGLFVEEVDVGDPDLHQ